MSFALFNDPKNIEIKAFFLIIARKFWVSENWLRYMLRKPLYKGSLFKFIDSVPWREILLLIIILFSWKQNLLEIVMWFSILIVLCKLRTTLSYRGFGSCRAFRGDSLWSEAVSSTCVYNRLKLTFETNKTTKSAL